MNHLAYAIAIFALLAAPVAQATPDTDPGVAYDQADLAAKCLIVQPKETFPYVAVYPECIWPGV
jgi:hypothetical protein